MHLELTEPELQLVRQLIAKLRLDLELVLELVPGASDVHLAALTRLELVKELELKLGEMK